MRSLVGGIALAAARKNNRRWSAALTAKSGKRYLFQSGARSMCIRPILGSVLAGLFLVACAQMGGGSAAKSDASNQTSPAEKQGVGPGMNADGEVIDASKVESGYGQKVKNGDWEGELTGKPAPNTCFTKLQIGMPLKQVTDLCGAPTDQGAYITGKAFIPFYFGSDRFRYELAYKAQGRLIFAGGSMGDLSGAHLIWVIYSAADSGYR
jgi:hypothetical protein